MFISGVPLLIRFIILIKKPELVAKYLLLFITNNISISKIDCILIVQLILTTVVMSDYSKV